MLTRHIAHSSPHMLFEFRGLEALPCGCVVADYVATLLSLDVAAVRGERAPLHGATPGPRIAADAGRVGKRGRRRLGVSSKRSSASNLRVLCRAKLRY